ncbi:MAG: hypothetical protein LBV31_04335 [Prevotellaceae bacterium]|nr:hypothetical protein [Prevotellaceae bacterium]
MATKLDKIILLIFSLYLFACGVFSKESNRVPFFIDHNYHVICVPMQITDSITANMLYDSGAVDGI